jgi:hypothetical protein
MAQIVATDSDPRQQESENNSDSDRRDSAENPEYSNEQWSNDINTEENRSNDYRPGSQGGGHGDINDLGRFAGEASRTVQAAPGEDDMPQSKKPD